MFIEIENKIRTFAEKNSRIRAVVLNGSRANPNVNTDSLQDYDLIFIVDDFNSFLENRDWLSHFGNPVLQQIPDEMDLGKEENDCHFSYTFLTYFDDGNRIDLTLYPKDKFETEFIPESLSIVWMDKDGLLRNIPRASEIDFHISKPTQQEFTEVCNEFWWCLTNVAKGLKREELIYAKEMMENVVRPMFLKLIEWKIGAANSFKVSTGKSGKFIAKYVDEEFYKSILATYADSTIENNWTALFLMMDIFREEQRNLADKLHLQSNPEEAKNAYNIVIKMRKCKMISNK